jgi:hypothetical protein
MTRLIGACGLVLASLLAASAASAQTDTEKIRARVTQGQKVSITDDQGNEVKGRIGAMTADGLTMLVDERAPMFRTAESSGSIAPTTALAPRRRRGHVSGAPGRARPTCRRPVGDLVAAASGATPLRAVRRQVPCTTLCTTPEGRGSATSRWTTPS